MMPRTCSRMKLSASPKPASGPVRGLTWPILMVRLCASAGMTRSTAGAATAPRPALPSVRRDSASGRDEASFMGHLPGILLGVALARLLEMLQHARAQRRLLLGTPLAEALAALEAELALRHQLFQIGRRARLAVDRGQHGLVDREREIGADHVGILQRPQHGEPSAERRLDHGVDGLGVADAVLDQRDR